MGGVGKAEKEMNGRLQHLFFLGTAAQRYRVIIFKFKLSIDKKKGKPTIEGFQKTIKKNGEGRKK